MNAYSSVDVYEIGTRINLVLSFGRFNSINILGCHMILLLFCATNSGSTLLFDLNGKKCTLLC